MNLVKALKKKKKFNLYVLLMVKTYKLKKTKQVH